MTVLWDLDPAAHQTYGFALGSDVTVATSSNQVSRALQDGAEKFLVVIGPDIPLDAACSVAEVERVDRPELGVVLLRHRLDVSVLAQALRSGVREVVQADDGPALADAVRRSLELSAQMAGSAHGAGSDGNVITIFSAKGGVGKTTLSTNLAAYLASTGAKTLLIDLDLMFGDVSISLQLSPAASMSDVAAMRGHLDHQALSSLVTHHDLSGLDVISAPSDPGDADRIPSSVVEELLRVARTLYDYILVDTPPSFTEHVLSSCDHSDLVLLVATLDIPAIKNLRIALNTLDALGAPQDTRVIVLNRSDAKVGLNASDVEAALKQPIGANVPSSTLVPSSVNKGLPVVLVEPKAPVSLALRQVADVQIRQRFGEETEAVATRGFRLRRGRK